MINKKIIKAEIDKMQDKYLEILYKIIKAFEIKTETNYSKYSQSVDISEEKKQNWHDFINETYGCLIDAPIVRENQGNYEIRKEII